MTSKQAQYWLIFGMAVTISLGIFFRFSNLASKVYWNDEAVTSLSLSGYLTDDIESEVSYNHIFKAGDLKKFHSDLSYRKGIGSTIRRLAKEDAQNPPLYYSLAYYWTQWTGANVENIRRLSAVFGLLAIPCLYWLSFEAFGNHVSARVSTLVFSISPFHLLWSQEARSYGLWTLTIILSSALFLKAIKKPKIYIWILYSLMIVLGTYTHLFTALVIFSHGSYILVRKSLRSQVKQILIPFTLSVVVSGILLLPWAIRINSLTAVGWTGTPLSRMTYLKIFILNIIRTFFDIDFDSNNFISYLGILIVLVVVCAVFYFAKAHQSENHNLFVLFLFVMPAMPLIAADITFGGQRALVSRFIIPSFLALGLIVSWYFASRIQTRIAQVSLCLVVILGILSSSSYNQSQYWWSKQFSNDNRPIANIINRHVDALTIVDNTFDIIDILSMSYELNPDAPMLRIPQNQEGFDFSLGQTIFWIDPDEQLYEKLIKENLTDDLVFNSQGRKLWKILRREST